MTTKSMQIQRYVLLGLSAAGLLLLAWLLRGGWLQTLVTELDTRTSLGVLSSVLERSPGQSGHAYLAWFHYLLMFTFAACFLQVLLSLLKPVRNPVLLAIDWGILLSAGCAMLFFWVFGLRPRTPELGPWLVVQASVACCALAMHAFGRAFIAYPSAMTDERVEHYRRRYVRSGLEFVAVKTTAFGRWRRAMLAWQLRKGRTSRLARSIRKSRKDMDPVATRRMLLRVFPCVTFAGLCGFWSSVIFLGEEGRWLGPVVVLPLLMIVYAWGLTMEKIAMDYRLGDATVRKQVLWLLIGVGLPLTLGAGYGFAFLLIFIAPSLFGYAIMFMFLYFPVLAFLVFVLCLMISIFFYGAIDPERVLRVGTLYGFLSFVLTVLFAIVEQLLSPLLVNAIGLDGMEGTIVSATVVALSFRPLRSRIEVGLERGFQKLLHGGAPASTVPATPQIAPQDSPG